jgi:hypothetical protein
MATLSIILLQDSTVPIIRKSLQCLPYTARDQVVQSKCSFLKKLNMELAGLNIYSYVCELLHSGEALDTGAANSQGLRQLQEINPVSPVLDMSDVLARLDQLLPAGMLDRAVEIVDKNRVLILSTNEDGSGPSLAAVKPSRISKWAGGSGQEVSSSTGALRDTLFDAHTAGIAQQPQAAPYIISKGTCSCPDFIAGVSSQVQLRPMVSESSNSTHVQLERLTAIPAKLTVQACARCLHRSFTRWCPSQMCFP